jgi:hypothetical protein
MYLQKVISRKTFLKKTSFLLAKIAGSGSESGSISQRHGSADQDLDPNQKCHESGKLKKGMWIRKPNQIRLQLYNV